MQTIFLNKNVDTLCLTYYYNDNYFYILKEKILHIMFHNAQNSLTQNFALFLFTFK